MRTAAVKGEMNMAQKVQKVRSKLEKRATAGSNAPKSASASASRAR